MATKTKEVKLPDMPFGITEEDCKYPDYEKRKDYVVGSYARNKKDPVLPQHVPGRMEWYFVKDWGWVLLTLFIRNPGRRSMPGAEARYYGTLFNERHPEGSQVRVGLGPHVLAKRVSYIKKSNFKRMQKLIEAYEKGLGQAQTVRDRISTRRAQGALRRGFYF